MTRSAIVTGASRGIGRAVAEMLLSEDWSVTGVSRSGPDIHHPSFVWWPGDISEPSITETVGRAEGFDALVHAAGVRGPYGPFWETDPAEWVQTVATNLLGTHNVVRAALPLLQRSEDGRILLFSGGGAFSPEPGYSSYAVTKGATVALMETLAAELAGTTVSVNCVAPGFVATSIHDGTPNAGRADAPGAMERAVACVRHLLSPATKGLTGKTVSAQWDDWPALSPWTIPLLGRMGERDRVKIACLEQLLIHERRVGWSSGRTSSEPSVRSVSWSRS